MTSSISSSAIDTNLQYDKDQDTRMLKVDDTRAKGQEGDLTIDRCGIPGCENFDRPRGRRWYYGGRGLILALLKMLASQRYSSICERHAL